MPGVNGYRGDQYPGGSPYPGPAAYNPRQEGYDPYSVGGGRDPRREDPYNYGREDPYSSRANPSTRPRQPMQPTLPAHPTQQPTNGYMTTASGSSRLPTTDDHYGRYGQPEDPYRQRNRPVDDPYSRVNKDRHNGASPSSVPTRSQPHEDAGNGFPQFEVDHLATFTVGAKQGLMSPTDGIRKLRQMELSTGIWTMRVTLVIEARELIVIDRATGEDMERFPIMTITQPTAVTNEDRRDVYNNIVLFTVREDNPRSTTSEMHMFQCIGKPAHAIVDDIKAAKAGKIRGSPSRAQAAQSPVNERIMEFEQSAQHNYNVARDYHQAVPSTQLLRQSMAKEEDNESVISERTDHDVQLLNHCFDDIEKFVGRLQSAAEAYRELDDRRRSRNNSNKKKGHHMGEGMLSMRSRPPPANDFIDVFQKFKLSFNLLAKLKPHIHDPNAPELVHFLFTPLSLVVEASKDPRRGTPDIAAKVLSPMLMGDAKELLLNCLSSKEMDLWYSLGDAWKLTREEYGGQVPPYYPRFSDGWEPPRSWYTDTNRGRQDEDLYHRNGHTSRETPSPYRDRGRDENPYDRSGQDRDRRDDNPYDRPPQDAHARALAEYEQEYRRREDRRMEKEMDGRRDDIERQRTLERERDRDYDSPRERERPYDPPHRAPMSFDEQQQEFLRDIKHKGAKPAKANHAREGKNAKELTIQKGQILEVLDSSRNWWKVRDNKDQVGHVPYTILEDLSAVRH